MQKRNVFVVGAGIAGLTAAYRLQQAGFTVQVLEARDVCGGRVGERRAGSIVYNAGARLVYPFSPTFNGLLRELRLDGALVPITGLGAACRADGGDYRLELMPGLATLATPFLTTGDRLRLLRSALDLGRLRAATDPDDFTTAGTLDDESLAGYIGRKLGPRALDGLIAPVFRGTRNWNLEEVSASFYATTMPHLLGRRTVYAFAGGMGRIIDALAGRLDVTRGARVERIVPASSGPCRVDYRLGDGTLRSATADIVVCATEGARVAGLVEETAPDRHAFFQAVRYNSLGVVHYAVEGAVAPAMRFFRRGEGRIGTYQQLPAAPDHGRPLAQLYCQLSPEATREAVRLGVTGSLDTLVRDDVRTLFPGIDARIREIHNQWIEHMLPLPYPGYGRRVAEFLRRQASERQPVYYCGDYLSQALLTGASSSGARVARTIREHWA